MVEKRHTVFSHDLSNLAPQGYNSKGLVQNGIRADVQKSACGISPGIPCTNDDFHAWLDFFQDRKGFNASHNRHIDIQDSQVDIALETGCNLNGFLAVGGCQNIISEGIQEYLDNDPDILLVVHHKNSFAILGRIEIRSRQGIGFLVLSLFHPNFTTLYNRVSPTHS